MGIFRPRRSVARPSPHSPITTTLSWKSGSTDEVADTGGHGRYLIRKADRDRLALFFDSALIGTFTTIADAKARAQLGYEAGRAAAKDEQLGIETGYRAEIASDK
jgi:hypothetical protein